MAKKVEGKDTVHDFKYVYLKAKPIIQELTNGLKFRLHDLVVSDEDYNKKTIDKDELIKVIEKQLVHLLYKRYELLRKTKFIMKNLKKESPNEKRFTIDFENIIKVELNETEIDEIIQEVIAIPMILLNDFKQIEWENFEMHQFLNLADMNKIFMEKDATHGKKLKGRKPDPTMLEIYAETFKNIKSRKFRNEKEAVLEASQKIRGSDYTEKRGIKDYKAFNESKNNIRVHCRR